MKRQPLLCRRPLVLRSQAQLFDLLDHSEPKNLAQVRTVTLQLTDVDLTALMGRHARITAWTLYQRELERLDEALRSLAGLRDLTIIPPVDNHSQLLRALYISIVALVPKLLSQLQRLVIEDSDDLLEKVPTLSSLHDVRFTMTTTIAADRGPPATKKLSPKLEEQLKAETDATMNAVAMSHGKVLNKIRRASTREPRTKQKHKVEPVMPRRERVVADAVLKARVRKSARQQRRTVARSRQEGSG
ncbi:hypothetical protein LTR62_007672 [Meristemomyces frigidus]|uniref:Uncharacterized protein n=1 Tax=Meristemomyces frigidus TaxID=1508187 RepID=A0AAN7TBV3_9PEZI|nr:hypothetical protein LTR62_007672 [Meristemomyces frigidus]